LKKYSESQIVVPRFNEKNGFYTTKQRSKLMGKIKSQDTKPEIKLRKALWNLGYRYRKNVKKLPGKPDLVFFQYKLIIFIDGEFWHGYNWVEKKIQIKSNRDFWIPKIERNMQRDKENYKLLFELGWSVIRFWEHEIRKNIEDCISQVENYIQFDQKYNPSSRAFVTYPEKTPSLPPNPIQIIKWKITDLVKITTFDKIKHR
jgi:DNA mismatch endonuclease (patch repair protein)